MQLSDFLVGEVLYGAGQILEATGRRCCFADHCRGWGLAQERAGWRGEQVRKHHLTHRRLDTVPASSFTLHDRGRPVARHGDAVARESAESFDACPEAATPCIEKIEHFGFVLPVKQL